ncbi:MAG: hypothetical protein ACI9H8_001517 [Lysobacterales bacterium]|jgi:hypothetical protein
MIMRRLGEAIAAQNWFVVIIEIMVVVVGIFIGLQVDDWNESRKDRIDEQVYLQRLHEDVLLAEQLSSRVRERRLQRHQELLEILDIVFKRDQRDTITDNECAAIAWSNAYNINVASIASLKELTDTGRLGIIRDTNIRKALVELQQTRELLTYVITEKTNSKSFVHLPSLFPELIQIEAYFDPAMGEVRALSKCNFPGMRASRSFLNQFSTNVDGYDAYIRDGLAPWISQFSLVHQQLDEALSVIHE